MDYACDCEAVLYELISCGGIYQIHKVVQLDPPSIPTRVAGGLARLVSGGIRSCWGECASRWRPCPCFCLVAELLVHN
ncbi:hypothetical protein Misp03_51430 [Microbispora sp. NBRC 16548]|nr:hypothetical protein Misp03_51430 [Microbispora sp. NBRC 16548]